MNPGTEDLAILGHAGNSLRLGLIPDIHHEMLDCTKPGEKQPKKLPERLPETLPKPCVARFASVFRPQAVEGSLVEVTGKRKLPTRVEKPTRLVDGALARCPGQQEGGKLAKGLYKGKFDKWPQGLDDFPMAPDTAFFNDEKSRRTAYAEMMAGRAA